MNFKKEIFYSISLEHLIMQLKKFFKNYLAYLQVLTLAIIFYLGTGVLLNYVEPKSIANWFWPDSYLPLQLLIFGGNFFLLTFLTQNRRLGLWGALTIATWLFFKLNHFIINVPAVLAIVATSGLLLGWLVIKPRWQQIRKENAQGLD